MITIKELARKLNLSTTTVSNVIHGKTHEVSASTIERVEKALIQYDYVPNINARNLAQNKSKIIGLAMKPRADKSSNIFIDPFISEIVGGIEKTVREAGYFMMIYASDEMNDILKQVSTWNVDGLLLFGLLGEDGAALRRKYKKPVVCIDIYNMVCDPPVYTVGLEDEAGAYEAVKYLTDLGHRKIAFMSDDIIGVDLERFRGYKKALADAGIEYEDRNFLKLNPWKEAVEKSLSCICETVREFTAVFCTSDLYAVQLIDKLSDSGIRIPEDISVIGFDDNAMSKYHRPGVTTVHQDMEKKGIVAAETLIRLLKGMEVEKSMNQLPTRLVIRDTVKDLRKT